MEQKINIDNLNDLQKQALVCMYYAMLPKTDARYKQRMHDWEVLEKRFGTKKTTYKHAKDAFDFYFPNNGRKGWSDDRDLKRRGHAYQEVFDLYKDYSADQLEKAVAEIIHRYEYEEPTFVSMKCGFTETVHNILNGNKYITVDGVYTLKEELNIGKTVFVTLGGDTGKFETGKEHKRMIKKITRDPMFLAQKSVDATEADKQVISDLLDTLRANLDHCVGMAANMIGVSKNIIVVAAGPFQFAMINPVITKKTGAFQTEEGCLSLDGVRPCTRYKEIEVDYLDTNFKKQHGKYIGWTAQIIQHEVDHCNGIVI